MPQLVEAIIYNQIIPLQQLLNRLLLYQEFNHLGMGLHLKAKEI